MKRFYKDLCLGTVFVLFFLIGFQKSINAQLKGRADVPGQVCADSAVVTELLDVKCYNDSNGSASIAIYYSKAPVVWMLDTIPMSGTDTIISFSNLPPGTFTAYYTDDLGCSDSVVFTIAGPGGSLSADSCRHTNLTCHNSDDGTLRAGGLTNPWGTIQYLWQNANGDTISQSPNAFSLRPGDYRLTVINACDTATCNQTITEPPAIAMAACSKTNVSCRGGSNGTATAGNVTNEIGPLIYRWTNSSNVIIDTTATATGLTAGTYTLVVKDNCDSLTCTVTITQPGVLSIAGCTHTDVNCNGESTGSVTAGTLTNEIGTVDYTWKDSTGAVVGTSATVSNLPAGTYTLTASDSCGSVTCSQTIAQSPPLSMSACSHTNVTCNGGNTGSVSAGALTNSIGSVSYSWKDSTGAVVGTSATVSNLPAGVYSLTANDSCGSVTCSQTIIQSPPLAMSACSHTNVSCNGGNDGVVMAGTLSNTSGTPHYSWKNSSNVVVGITDTVSGLSAGVYTLSVTDDCGTITCTQTITQPTSVLSIGACNHTDVTCSGAATGTVTAGTVSNSSGTVSYVWKNSSNIIFGTTASVSNLPAGTYTLTVTDNCGSVTCSQTILQPSASLSIGPCTHTNVACGGGNTGSVTAGAVSNANGTVSYNWTNSSNVSVGTTPTVSSLPIGTYILTVTDQCGSATCSVAITEPLTGITIGSCSHTDVTCYGGSTGTLTAGSITNSTGTITYRWRNASNVVVGTTANVTGLSAGVYTLTVTDQCGADTCIQTIVQPSSPLAMAACTQTDAHCHGSSNGSVTAGLITGSSGAIQYRWRNSNNAIVGSTATVNNLPADLYTLTITDACGTATCMTTISEPDPLFMSACTYVDANCNNSLTGVVSAGGITGAVGNLVYTWKRNNTTVGTTAIVTSLHAGTYTLSVHDDCSTLTCSVTIDQPPPMVMSPCTHSDAGCYGTSTGSVSAGTITGATGPVYYTWSDTTNNPVSYSSTVSGLPAGDYTLTVMTDCGTLSCTQTVSQFPELTVFGCSSTDACFGGSTGTVDAGLVSGSVGMVNYMWVNDSADIVGTTPYVDNLVPGNYYLTVTDNCNTVLCDLFINATDTLQSSFSTTACEAYMLPWGTMANVTGDYTYNYSTSVGCDSIVTAHVEVNTNFSTTFTDSAYLSYTLPWGIAVSLSGDYTYTYVAANGCDSIVTAKITILIPTGVNEASVSQNDLFEIVGSSLQISDMVTRSELYNVEGQIVPNDNLAGGIYLLRIIYRDKIFIFKIKM